MSDTNALVQAIDRPSLDRVATPLRDAVRDTFEAGGAAGQEIKDLLHGVWLRHPLHPVFTDIPIGAWTAALAIDAAAGDDPGMKRAATFAFGVGLLGALASAATGLTDWSETDGEARRTGMVHGLLNITATGLVAASYAQRRRDSNGRGRGLAWAGYLIALGAAYLGGDLVYRQRIGVTHADIEPPEDFTPVLASSMLADNTMTRVRVGDRDVLLVRKQNRLFALSHACAHLGGPLSEGTLKNDSVVCPWHGSEFALEDGRVLNGPSTHRQPCLQVRERNGQIEIKQS